MSVVAWDGNILAADRMGVNGNLKILLPKIKILKNKDVVAWVGDYPCGLMLADWYESGAKKENWPEFKDDQFATLIVLKTKEKTLETYTDYPIAEPVYDKLMAWGSGRDFALTAMYLYKTAPMAVNIAARFDSSCGNGVECYDIDRPAKTTVIE
jgi:hypothetical protein